MWYDDGRWHLIQYWVSDTHKRNLMIGKRGKCKQLFIMAGCLRTKFLQLVLWNNLSLVLFYIVKIFLAFKVIRKFCTYSYDTFFPIHNKSKTTIVLSILHLSYDKDYVCGILWHQNLCNGSYKDRYTNKPMIYTINMSTCCWFTKSYLACALNYL